MIVSTPKVMEATQDLKTILRNRKPQLEEIYRECHNIKICAKMVYVDLQRFMGGLYQSAPQLVEKIRVYADFETACSNVLLS